MSLLFFSTTGEMTNFLIEQGLSIFDTDKHGNTPLHIAAYEGFEEVVSTLLQKQADKKKGNRWGQTPSQLATTPAMANLFAGNRTNATKRIDEANLSITIYEAAKNGNEQVIRYLLSSGVDPNLLNYEEFQIDYHYETPLYHAIYVGYHRIADLLLQHGANPNIHKNVSLYRSVYNVASAQALHKYGAKATSKQWDEAYWEAIVNVRNSALLQTFIDYGAPLDHLDFLHQTVQRVDKTTEEHPKMAKILVEQKPSWLQTISINETPLLKAVDMENKTMIECLLELGQILTNQTPTV